MTNSDEKTPAVSWQVLMRARISRLEREIELSEIAGVTGAEADEIRRAAKAELRTAETALGMGGGTWQGRLRSWVKRLWTGSDQEQAWLAVHAAECYLALVESEQSLRAELPALEAKVRGRLRASDPLRATWVAQLAKARESGAPNRHDVRQIKETLFDASDTGHARTRSFRNVLVLVTVALTVAAVIFALPFVSDWIPLETASAVDADAEGTSGEAAADDEDESDGPVESVWQIELLGALGGLLAALAGIQRLRGFRNPYNLPIVQALLKVPAGALTGLAGAVFMQGDVGFLEAQSGAAVAAYAIVFGAAQDVITRFVDRKAKEISEVADPAEPDAGTGG